MGILKQRLNQANDIRNNNKICELQQRLHAPIETQFDPRSPEYRAQMAKANDTIRSFTATLKKS